MSNHSNQHRSAPSAPGSKKIMGASPTYKSRVQRAARGITKSDSEEAGEARRMTEAPQEAFGPTQVKSKDKGFGSGHYTG